MRSNPPLPLLSCVVLVTALPVNSPMNKGDTEVMKCIVEVISDTLSKPSPTPVSQECLETLRGDERILSILRHQNLLKELQDLALQGTLHCWPSPPALSPAPGRSMALVVDGAPKPGAEDARPPEGRGERPGQEEQEEQQEEEDAAGAPRGRAGKSGEQEPRPSREWEEAPRWSKMDQLAQELTAGKRLDGEDEEDDPGPDPDRSMKLSFRARAFGPRGPDLQLRRGWRPSSREDSVEAGLPLQARGYPEEKKEEEGSANRRAEDQELESLSAIEAELEKVAHQLQVLRRG
uniref:Chromogranin-A n=1 Tax=Marmota marmota marmota TaxID=9994 RepID=A0A8C6ELU9_MARMA